MPRPCREGSVRPAEPSRRLQKFSAGPAGRRLFQSGQRRPRELRGQARPWKVPRALRRAYRRKPPRSCAARRAARRLPRRKSFADRAERRWVRRRGRLRRDQQFPSFRWRLCRRKRRHSPLRHLLLPGQWQNERHPWRKSLRAVPLPRRVCLPDGERRALLLWLLGALHCLVAEDSWPTAI
jgi:hypothetical protein